MSEPAPTVRSHTPPPQLAINQPWRAFQTPSIHTAHEMIREFRKNKSTLNHTSTRRCIDNEEVWGRYCWNWGNNTLDERRHSLSFCMEYIYAIYERREPNFETAMKLEPYNELHPSELTWIYPYTTNLDPSKDMTTQEFNTMMMHIRIRREQPLPPPVPPPEDPNARTTIPAAVQDRAYQFRQHLQRDDRDNWRDKCMTCFRITDEYHICPRENCPLNKIYGPCCKLRHREVCNLSEDGTPLEDTADQATTDTLQANIAYQDGGTGHPGITHQPASYSHLRGTAVNGILITAPIPAPWDTTWPPIDLLNTLDGIVPLTGYSLITPKHVRSTTTGKLYFIDINSDDPTNPIEYILISERTNAPPDNSWETTEERTERLNLEHRRRIGPTTTMDPGVLNLSGTELHATAAEHRRSANIVPTPTTFPRSRTRTPGGTTTRSSTPSSTPPSTPREDDLSGVCSSFSPRTISSLPSMTTHTTEIRGTPTLDHRVLHPPTTEEEHRDQLLDIAEHRWRKKMKGKGAWKQESEEHQEHQAATRSHPGTPRLPPLPHLTEEETTANRRRHAKREETPTPAEKKDDNETETQNKDLHNHGDTATTKEPNGDQAAQRPLSQQQRPPPPRFDPNAVSTMTTLALPETTPTPTQSYATDPFGKRWAHNGEVYREDLGPNESPSPGHLNDNNAYHQHDTGEIFHWTKMQGEGWYNNGSPGLPSIALPGQHNPIRGYISADGTRRLISIYWPATYHLLLDRSREQAVLHYQVFRRPLHTYQYFCLYCEHKAKTAEELQQHLAINAGNRHPPVDILTDWMRQISGSQTPWLLEGVPHAEHLPFMNMFNGHISFSVSNTNDNELLAVISALQRRNFLSANTMDTIPQFNMQDLGNILGNYHNDNTYTQQQVATLSTTTDANSTNITQLREEIRELRDIVETQRTMNSTGNNQQATL